MVNFYNYKKIKNTQMTLQSDIIDGNMSSETTHTILKPSFDLYDTSYMIYPKVL